MFYYPDIRNLFNLKLFVDTDADIRLARLELKYCHNCQIISYI